jgi:hypothetical protein
MCRHPVEHSPSILYAPTFGIHVNEAITHTDIKLAAILNNLLVNTPALFKCCYTGTGIEGEPLAGREATAPSIIIEIREVQWREETPPNGGVVTPKDIQMQPFRFKS